MVKSVGLCVNYINKNQVNSIYFWKTHNGAEFDLYWKAKGNK